MAKDANATASFVVGGGAKLAGFGAVSVDADGNVSLDFGSNVSQIFPSLVLMEAKQEKSGKEPQPPKIVN